MANELSKRTKGAYFFTLFKIIPSPTVMMLCVGIRPPQSFMTRNDAIVLRYCESRFGKCSIGNVETFVRTLLDEIYCFTGVYSIPAMFTITPTKLPLFIERMRAPFLSIDITSLDQTPPIDFRYFYNDLVKIYNTLARVDEDDTVLKIITYIPTELDPTEARLLGLQHLTYPRYNMNDQNTENEILRIITGRTEQSKYAYLHCAQERIQTRIVELGACCQEGNPYQSLAMGLIHYLTKRHMIMEKIKNTSETDPLRYDFATVYACAEAAFLEDKVADLRPALDSYWTVRRINTLRLI